MTVTPPSNRTNRRVDADAAEVHAAPSWRRAIALAIDALPLLTIWLLCAAALASASPEPEPAAPWNLLDRLVDYVNARPTVVIGSAAMFAGLLFALPLVAQLLFGRTPGKRVMGIALVDRRGQRPSARRQAAHCALRVLSIALLFAGVLWALADPERRTLHDRLAGVWAVVTPHPPR